MSNSPLPPTDGASPQIHQHTSGDNNLVIGQMVGGMVVYGQVIYNTSPEPTIQNKPKLENLGPNPYRGLLAFQEIDGDRFFGRQLQIDALWEKLRQLQESTATPRLLAIYGPSGSGKSSLARAGLIPELSRRPLPGYDQARVVSLMPGSHPIEALATILARITTNELTPVIRIREFAQELGQASQTGDYDGLRRIADLLPEIALRPLVVLVDQLEEVYTLCKDPKERDVFINTLLNAASDASRRVIVIATLRSDFLGATQKHPQLNQLIANQGFFVSAMGAEGLRQAICQPAERAGYPLDEATVTLLVNDTEGREGALPLLQFALTRIWEGLPQKPPAQTLEEIGGVGGALAGEAQRIFATLTPEEQKIARRVFLGLVQLGEGTKDTRRRALVEGLLSHQEQSEQVKAVIQRFAEPGVRLITVAGDEQAETAEVTHETLFEHWQQLQTWLEGSRSDLRFERRLEEAARYWQTQGKPEGSLWRPPDLDLLQQYRQRVGDELSPLQMEFAQASTAAEDQRKQEAENRRLEKERQLRFQKRATRGLAGLSIGALAFGAYALVQSYWVQRQRAELLGVNANALMATQPVDGTVNAIAAVGLSQSPLTGFPDYALPASSYGGLLTAVQRNQEMNKLQEHTSGFGFTSVAFSPDGKRIVSGSWETTLHLWNAQTGKLIGQPLQGHTDVVTSVAFSLDGERIVSGSGDKTIRLWDAQTGQPIGQPLKGHTAKVTEVTFSPDGKRIVSGSEDKTLRLWDAQTGQPIGQPLQGHTDAITSVAFSPDGKRIASGSEDNTLRLWDAQTGQPIGQPLHSHTSGFGFTSVAFSPDGKRIVSGSLDYTLRLWDAQTGQPIGQPLQGHTEFVWSVAFSPDGKQIASGSGDKTLRLWDAQTGKPIGQPLQGHTKIVSSVAFSPDGKRIASGSEDNTLRLWDAQAGQPIGQTLQGHTKVVISVAFSPDGKRITSGSGDKTLRLWDVQTGQPIGQPLQGHTNFVLSVAFSPDGKRIASGSGDNTVRLWDAQTGQPIGQPLQGHTEIVSSVAFSPDGKRIVRGMEANTGRSWDGQTGQPSAQPLHRYTSLVPLQGHTSPALSVAYSPDGRLIVSSSSDKTLRFWDTQTGQLIGQPLQGHTDEVTSVAFSPDGRRIVSGSKDGTLRLWDVSWQSLLTTACNRLRYHPVLRKPQNDTARDAKATCERFVWK
jgi:WD40 repeat protein